jgi:hypothetical protein
VPIRYNVEKGDVFFPVPHVKGDQTCYNENADARVACSSVYTHANSDWPISDDWHYTLILIGQFQMIGSTRLILIDQSLLYMACITMDTHIQRAPLLLATMHPRERAAFTTDPHVITLILWLSPYCNTTSSSRNGGP